MDENLRETTELPESGGTAPNEENEPETKSIRFVPSAYDPRGIEQWLSERAAEGKLLLRYDDFVIGEPRDCRYHLEPAADDDDPDELLREKRARLGWEYVCRTKDGIFYIWRGDRTAHVPTPKDCTDSYGYRRLCKKLRRSYFLPLLYLVADVLLIYLLFYVWSIPLLSLLTMPKNDVIQGVSLLLGSIIGMFSGAQERKEMRTLKRAMEDCEYVEQMRQLYRISKAERLPNFSAKGLADYETNDYADEESSRDPEFSAKLSVSWELDLWGNLRWAKRKGGAEYLSSVEDWRAMRMTLVAEVATAYFQLMALDNELSIVRRTLRTRSEGVQQAQLRFEGGLTSETVYQQAKVEYASTATLIPDLESRIEIMENSIALLMGKSPDWEVLRGQMNIEAEFPDSLPVGLPSGLLQRRPDVRASEQQLRSAMASAGMAYADRFPRLTFNLVGGWENDALQGFFRSPFSYVAAAIAAPVFGFGRKQAKYRAALAAYDVARLGYEKKVLEVFKEANDAVVTYRNVRKTAALKVALRDAARKYVELANLQYRGGSINYIDVLDAQRRYFDAQIGLSNAVRDEHLALVQLYKALGGGWELEEE